MYLGIEVLYFLYLKLFLNFFLILINIKKI
jgi:hypothetical protein